jgi:hypothetical protein
MRDGIKFVELEFQLGTNVNVRSLVLGAVTILGRGEYWDEIN